MDSNLNISDPEIFAPDTGEQETITGKTIIKVIGVGGGGCNAANYLYKQGIDNVSFLVCNTDMHSLRELAVPNRIILGPDITHGLGAGDNPELGGAAAEASREDIRRELSDNTRMVFITAGMGGGTGTGAAPVVASVAKEMNILTVGIVTIPFFFEGEKKIIKALKGAEEMRKHVDTLLIVNNERLTEIYRDLNLINAFEKADDTLANAARSIADIINTRGYINTDFNDVKTTLENSSTAIISTGYGEGENRVTKSINDALNSPLLRNSDIRSSKRLLFVLYFNPKAESVVTMDEMNEITLFTSTLSKSIDTKWGYCFDDTLGDRVKMSILASGFDLTVSERGTADGGKEVITFPGKRETENRQAGTPAPEQEALERREIIAGEYGEDKITAHSQAMARANYVVLKPSQFDDDEAIVLFSKFPARMRDSQLKEKIRNTGPGSAEAKRTPAREPEHPGATHEGGDSTIVF